MSGMNLPAGGAGRAVIKAMVIAESDGSGAKGLLDSLLAQGFVVVPRVATQDMLSAWCRQRTPGENPTLQQRYQRMIRKRPT